jgi:hypothetical protein
MNSYRRFGSILFSGAKSVALILAFSVLNACTPWGYKEYDKPIAQHQVERDGYKFRYMLHKIKGYDEYRIFLWCQTGKTQNLDLKEQLSSMAQAAAFTQKGWKAFEGSPTATKAISSDYVLNQPVVLNERVLYVGSWGYYISFDSCATAQGFSSDLLFSKQVKNNEVTRGYNFVRVIPFMQSFDLNVDESGGCFIVDPRHIKVPNTSFKVCTQDRGKTWVVVREERTDGTPGMEGDGK